ncbi:tetratricopeptide repeat protein [Desulfonema ishimotonii]|nr:tetratricopeptide repeat protein [Desulfonema ishimotonii]
MWRSMDRKTLLKIFIAGLLLCLCSCSGQSKEVRKRQGEASRDVGEAYMHAGNYTGALRELLKAEELTPDDIYIQNDLGLTYMAKERTDLAIRHFKKALDKNPGFTAARNNLGTAHMANSDWDAAITTFKKVLEDLLYPTPHFPHSNLGWAYYNKKQYDLAARHYSEALESQPRFVIAMRGLGRTYVAMKKIPDAVGMFKKAIGISPRFAPLYLDLAKAYTAANDRRSALDIYRKVIAAFPGTPYADEAQRDAGALLLNSGS